MDKAAPDPLSAIRARIDDVDAEMHRLLIERSGVIDELIRIKGTSKPGAAFRPDREADMMRRLVARHSGGLPLITVEHIWREIITTFTAMQAPFGVVAGPADALAMRDIVRFYFGFAVDVDTAKTSAAAIKRVTGAGRHIAVVAANAKGRWWEGLLGAKAPKVFAKLPFIEMPDRPAALAAYVIGPPLKQGSSPDIRVLAVKHTPRLKKAVIALGGSMVARDKDESLVELPVAVETGELAERASIPSRSVRECGGFFAPIRYVSERVR